VFKLCKFTVAWKQKEKVRYLIHMQYCFTVNIKCTGYRIWIFRPHKGGSAKMASPRVPHLCREVSDSYYTFISRFSLGLFWDTPNKKVKSLKWLTTLIPAINVLVVLVFFSLQKHCDGRCFHFPLNSLNTMLYGSKTCSRNQTVSKGPSDIYLFLVRLRRFAKPRSTKPRKVMDECINNFLNDSEL